MVRDLLGPGSSGIETQYLTHGVTVRLCAAHRRLQFQQGRAARAMIRSPRVGVASGGHPDPTALESTCGPRTADQIRTGDGRSAGELHMAVPARRGRDAICRRRRSPRRDRRRAEPIDRRCDASVVSHPAPLVRRRQVVWTVSPPHGCATPTHPPADGTSRWRTGGEPDRASMSRPGRAGIAEPIRGPC